MTLLTTTDTTKQIATQMFSKISVCQGCLEVMVREDMDITGYCKVCQGSEEVVCYRD